MQYPQTTHDEAILVLAAFVAAADFEAAGARLGAIQASVVSQFADARGFGLVTAAEFTDSPLALASLAAKTVKAVAPLRVRAATFGYE